MTDPAYTGTISPADEDGYCWVEIFEAGEPAASHSIRYDQANQWLAQELDCLNDPRVYGIDLPETALMDAEELDRSRTHGGIHPTPDFDLHF